MNLLHENERQRLKACLVRRRSNWLRMDKRLQKFKQNVNVNFFKKQTPEMAYVLGCFASDGGMFINSRGSKYIQFTSTDKKFLKNIRMLLKSKHKISKKKHGNKNWNYCYVVQIGSKDLFSDLKNLGFRPNKSKKLVMPEITDILFKHFVRGYFEGDGCVWYGTYNKKNRTIKPRLVQTHFICGDRAFLKKLSVKLSRLAKTVGGSIVNKDDTGFDLSYSKKDSIKLYDFIYRNKRKLFSDKKYDKFTRALEFAGT